MNPHTRRHPSRPRAANRTRRPNAFSLLELLVVIGVIVILIAAIIVASPRLIGAQQSTQAEGLLATLDRALDEYQLTRGRFPLYGDDFLDRYESVFDQVNLDPGPIVDYGGREHALTPDAWMFYDQATGFGDVDAILENIPESLTRSRPIRSTETTLPPSVVRFIDPWGRRILFVHPSNDAAQDLFGRCKNNRPYFLSAGPDSNFGFFSEVGGETGEAPGGPAGTAIRQQTREAVEDNIYSTPPGRFVPPDDSTAAVDTLRAAGIPLANDPT